MRSRYIWAIKCWVHVRMRNNGEWCALTTYKSPIKGNSLHQYVHFYMFWWGMNALMEKHEMKMYYKEWTNLVSLYSNHPQWAPAITSSCISVRSLSLSSLSQRNPGMARKTSSSVCFWRNTAGHWRGMLRHAPIDCDAQEGTFLPCASQSRARASAIAERYTVVR